MAANAGPDDDDQRLIEETLAWLDQQQGIDADPHEPDVTHPTSSIDHLNDYEQERQRLDIDHRRDLNTLKKTYAGRFFWVLAAQLLGLNGIFIASGLGWLRFGDFALHTFIVGTLAQIVSIILVIAKHLFPAPEPTTKKGRKKAGKKKPR